jgi:LPS O-antigen subunit length determinant protein (WzzB/FepE family)
MSVVFVVGFMAFLAGAVAGIVWRTVADIKYMRNVEATLNAQAERHARAIARKDREIKRLFAALNAAQAAQVKEDRT